MFKQLILGSVVVVALVATGCASKSTKSAGAGSGTGAGTEDAGGLNTRGASDGSSAGRVVAGVDLTKLSLAERTVYFEFDSSELTASGQAVVAVAAKYLVANPTAKVRLAGHGDERGTREYNVGLGERRANTVQAALVGSGASAVQLSIVSYGEERPVDAGHDEAAWSKNRRVEIDPL